MSALIPSIQQLSAADPVLAYLLLSGRANLGRYQIYTIEIDFPTGAVDVPVVANWNQQLCTDFWVKKLSTNVWRPNAFAGSIQKAQSDYYNARNSNIGVNLFIGGVKAGYPITQQETPLENLDTDFTGCEEYGWVIRCGRTMEAQAFLRRPLADDELPTKAFIVIGGFDLGCDCYGDFFMANGEFGGPNYIQARDFLVSNNYLPKTA